MVGLGRCRIKIRVCKNMSLSALDKFQHLLGFISLAHVILNIKGGNLSEMVGSSPHLNLSNKRFLL